MYENYTIKDLDFNTSLAGSTDVKYHPKFNMSELNSELLKFQIKSRKSKESGKSRKKQELKQEGSDYYPYESILSKEFQVPKIKNIKMRPLYTMDEIHDSYLPLQKGRIDLKDIDKKSFDMREDDCYGEWGPWDESNCKDENERCSLKSRIYSVVKPKKKEGKPCMFKGNPIKDGAIQFDYCYGSSDNERCGINKNVCSCNIDKDKNCSLEDDKNCSCPPGHNYEYNRRRSGKCVPRSNEEDIFYDFLGDPNEDGSGKGWGWLFLNRVIHYQNMIDNDSIGKLLKDD